MAETDAAVADTSHALNSWQDALARARSDVAAWKQDLGRAVAPFQTTEEPAGPGLDDALTDAEAELSKRLETLETAHAELMAAYDSAVTDQASEAAQRLEWQRSEQTRTLRSQTAQMADEGLSLLVAARAAAGRALFEAATREWNQPRPCRTCSTPVIVGAVWQPTTFTCDDCGEKTTYEPAPLTERFYDGPSLDAICAEQALEQWRALRTAQRRYTSIAHPLPTDFDAFRAAATAWATTQAELHGELHPAWDSDRVAQAVTDRTREAVGDADDAEATAVRDRFAEGSTVAAGGDLAQLMVWAQENCHATPMTELVSQLAICVHEHGDRTTAWQVIALQHHVQQISEDRDSWMRDRLTELDTALRLR
jgi:hypothetical protein